jgi:hypothetical protein
MSTTIIYGNLGFDDDGNLYAISGSGDFAPTFNNTGLYTVQFNNSFTNIPTVTLTQLFMGDSNSNNLNEFTSNGGDTRDNAVMIAVDEKHFRFGVGSSNGSKQNRTVGFIAVGTTED